MRIAFFRLNVSLAVGLRPVIVGLAGIIWVDIWEKLISLPLHLWVTLQLFVYGSQAESHVCSFLCDWVLGQILAVCLDECLDFPITLITVRSWFKLVVVSRTSGIVWVKLASLTILTDCLREACALSFDCCRTVIAMPNQIRATPVVLAKFRLFTLV